MEACKGQMLTREIVVKAHVGRWSEDCPEHSGCVVYSMADIPLGFGVVGSFRLMTFLEDVADIH
jgi:ribosome biogenesis protein Nip4